MTEADQVQAIANGMQATADALSIAGDHVGAARVAAGVQLLRGLWTRLRPPETPPESE